MPALNKINVDGIKIKTSESGIGPSDHTSFYLKDIPVLHFFTGTHADYHKPSDDADKVNYSGEASIVKYILALVDGLNSRDKLAFSKTKDEKNEDTPRFKVTLGVVPDYAFDGEGMRIDGISEGKAAAHAGLKAGDVVIQLGDNKVLDMMSYMKALSKFTKGSETIVKVKRDKEILDYKVLFQ
jgi:S1-C subfamily serine protease